MVGWLIFGAWSALSIVFYSFFVRWRWLIWLWLMNVKFFLFLLIICKHNKCEYALLCLQYLAFCLPAEIARKWYATAFFCCCLHFSSFSTFVFVFFYFSNFLLHEYNHYAVEYSNIVYHHRTLLFVEVVKKLFQTAHYDENHIFNFKFDLNYYTNGCY